MTDTTHDSVPPPEHGPVTDDGHGVAPPGGPDGAITLDDRFLDDTLGESSIDGAPSNVDPGASSDTAPHPYPKRKKRLSKAAFAMLTESDDVRIEHIQKDAFVPYARAVELLNAMENLLLRPKVMRPKNFLILAVPNNGKTSLLTEFHNRHPGDDDITGDSLYMPVIFVQSPSEPKKVEFEDSLLMAMRIDPKAMVDKKQKIVETLTQYRTRVVLLDEANALLAGSATRQRQVINDIRWISNASKVSFVLAGAPETANVMTLDAHTGTRFPVQLMRRWAKTDQDYIDFLKGYEYILPLRQASNLERHADIIHSLTEGVLGSIVQLIQDSATKAILQNKPGEEFITDAILRSCHVVQSVTDDDLKTL